MRTFIGLVVAVVVFTAIGASLFFGVGPLPGQARCEATVGGRTVELDTEQAENVALMAAIGVERGLPARAVTIAIATARQESKWRNLDYGDRDSLGLFQQRPSQGWGTEAQVQRPTYAINAFYDALVEVPGYTELPITVAAQTVQRSAFPDAYGLHEADSRVLASALTGYSPARFTCTVRRAFEEDLSDRLNDAGLTPAAARVRRNVERAFGDQSLGGFAPGGVTTGHQPGSAHYEGRAVDIFFRPVGDPVQNREGWAVAQYLVAQAERLKIETVIFDERIWTARRSSQGWRDYDVSASRSGDRDILLHRDHVHVDVAD